MSRSDHADQGPGPDAYDATPYLPKRGGLTAHRRAAAECQGCPLHENATQTVFGKGAATARIVLVGEQPGDQEDKRGEPFVGPAGRLLAELHLVRPDVVVALGATAGKALLGRSFRVTKDRGTLIPLPEYAVDERRHDDVECYVVATLHPSAVLRSDDRKAAYAGLVSDLKVAAGALRRH
jgi:DNA polymerase